MKTVILGASRGLGRELSKHICDQGIPVMGWARKEPLLKQMAAEQPLFAYGVADFSKTSGQDLALQYLSEHSFDKVFLIAGGGPYGRFEERKMADHLWAWETSFLFHAKVLHLLASKGAREQVILVGSSVAESEGDPNAASYCAAKHALKGLFLSLRAENPKWDLRLFSPGYMDTDLLPKNAPVRSGEAGIYDAAQIARELWQWTLTPDATAHKMYAKFPSEE